MPWASFEGSESSEGSVVSSSRVRQVVAKDFRAAILQKVLFKQSVEGSQFCDATLVIGDNVIKAHWCVLVECPYFEALYNFHSAMKEPLTGEVRLSFGSDEVMKAAIQYLYTGEVRLSMDNIESYLAVADYLQIQDLMDTCVSFLSQKLYDLDNCVKILLIASLYNLDEKYEDVLRFVHGNLQELMEGDQLLDLTSTSVHSFFTEPTLSYISRSDFFNFLVRWTERDVQSRAKHFQEMFQALDLLLVSPCFLLDTIMEQPLVKASQECMTLCNQALSDGKKDVGPDGTPLTDVIIMGGGGGDKAFRYEFYSPHCSTNKLVAYFVREDRWARLPNLPYSMKKPVLTVTERGKLLVVNAFQSGTFEKAQEILTFCPRTCSWDIQQISFPPDHTNFEVHFILSRNDQVYLVTSSRLEVSSSRHQPSRGSKKSQQSEIQGTIHHYVLLLELDMTSGKLHPRFTFFQRSLQSEIQVACSQANGRANTTLNGDVLYVLGSKCFHYRATALGRSFTKLSYYDVKSRYGREVHIRDRCTFEPMGIDLPEGFLNIRLGKVARKFFDLKDKKIVPTSNHTVPLPPCNASRQYHCYISVRDELYIFGGKDYVSGSPAPTCLGGEVLLQQQAVDSVGLSAHGHREQWHHTGPAACGRVPLP
ncbi:kelch-like protein 11 [Babylonia areolata]|uniref:kelch-like protein 11 n=1 Tax=Babylonia areolata TaxID=304850 RepID=UPI003FD160C5